MSFGAMNIGLPEWLSNLGANVLPRWKETDVRRTRVSRLAFSKKKLQQLPYYKAPSLCSYSPIRFNILIKKKTYLCLTLSLSFALHGHRELMEVKARNQHEIGANVVIGAGFFVLTGLKAKEHASLIVVLSSVVSGISALLFVF